MIRNETRIRARQQDWGDQVEICIYDNSKDHVFLAGVIHMDERVRGEYIKPSMTIDKTTAQILMDDLWSSGLRPTQGAGSAGSLLATQSHLEDMRTIVFKKLGIEKQ